MANSRPFDPFRKLSSHIDLCAVEGIDGTIEKTIRANKEGHSNLLPQLGEFTCSRDSSQVGEGLQSSGILYVQ